MDEIAFQNWLEIQVIKGRFNKKVASCILSRTRRLLTCAVMQDKGFSLDNEYLKDRLVSVIDKLNCNNIVNGAYAKLAFGIKINGNPNTGIASIRNAIIKYQEFKEKS